MQRTGGPSQLTQTTPCGQARPVYDVAGRINDLINCYLMTLGADVKIYLPLVIVGFVVLVVMVLSARELIKE